jgi:hypothetical protein
MPPPCTAHIINAFAPCGLSYSNAIFTQLHIQKARPRVIYVSAAPEVRQPRQLRKMRQKALCLSFLASQEAALYVLSFRRYGCQSASEWWTSLQSMTKGGIPRYKSKRSAQTTAVRAVPKSAPESPWLKLRNQPACALLQRMVHELQLPKRVGNLESSWKPCNFQKLHWLFS